MDVDYSPLSHHNDIISSMHFSFKNPARYIFRASEEDTQMKENQANSYIILEEEKTHDVRSPDHALKPAPARRASRDPISRGKKDRNRDNTRIISQ